MRAIILAAGRGSRMKDATEAVPKCFVELAGRRLIEWQRAALEDAGIKQIQAVGGYRHELLNAYVDVSFVNSRWMETNIVGSLCCASEVLRREPCVVSYSDIVYHPSIVRALIESDYSFSLTFDTRWQELWEYRLQSPLDDAETFQYSGDLLLEIGRSPESLAEVQGQYMGLLYFTPQSWRWVEDYLGPLRPAHRDRLDMTALIQGLITSSREVHVVPIAGKWCEVDTQMDREKYEAALKTGAWSHDWRWRSDDTPVSVAPSH